MALKWWTKFNVVQKRCPIVFQGHLSNCKVTRDKKSLILTRIERFRTVTPVWIRRWIWNYAQSLAYSRRGVLLLYEVIHQISRPHRLKDRQLESNFNKITRSDVANKSLRFPFLSSYHVHLCNTGFGEMALSNAFGGSILQMLVCLGIPWLTETIMTYPEPMPLQESVLLPVSFVVASGVASLAFLWIKQWRITRCMAVIFLIMYAAVIAGSIAFQLLAPAPDVW